MQTYSVHGCTTYYGLCDFKVEAENAEAALNRASEMMGDQDKSLQGGHDHIEVFCEETGEFDTWDEQAPPTLEGLVRAEIEAGRTNELLALIQSLAPQ